MTTYANRMGRAATETFDHLAPTASPPAARWPALPPEPASIARDRRILVVDDDATIRSFFTEVLRHAAFHVACAEDGEAGWSALRAESFDLMITDHNMPRLTGLELLRRARAAARDLPVILISAGVPWHEPDLAALLRPGLALSKPFSIVELLAGVRRLLTPVAAAAGPRRAW